MKKVFVINRGGHDYSRAERFGSLVYCSEGLLAKSDIGHMFRIIQSKMVDSGPEDYILISGLSSMSSVACAIFGHKHGRLNLLIYWDGDYVERNILLQPTDRSATDESVPLTEYSNEPPASED